MNGFDCLCNDKVFKILLLRSFKLLKPFMQIEYKIHCINITFSARIFSSWKFCVYIFILMYISNFFSFFFLFFSFLLLSARRKRLLQTHYNVERIKYTHIFDLHITEGHLFQQFETYYNITECWTKRKYIF